jgi:uncharacterized RDD family membrane protein YckC
MQDGIITGEGVLLDTRPSSFASRFLGALIDVVVYVVAAFIVITVVGATGAQLDDSAGAILGVVMVVVLTVAAPVTIETLTRGRSLGKLAAGIRIVRDDGGPVRFRHALIRALVGIGELWMTAGSVALITSLVNPKGKRLGDFLAGTYAIRVRGGERVFAPAPIPIQLVGWAHIADIRRLPDGLALAVRQFLVRTSTLHPASRVQLGTELSREVERYVSPLPPPGTHPEAFLAAVLGARREREYAAAMSFNRRQAADGAALHRLPHQVPDPVD